MTSKIIKALAKILEVLQSQDSLEEVNKKLIFEKDLDEITLSTAFSLIYDKMLAYRSNERRPAADSMRVFSDEERELIGKENVNYLMYLHNVGLIKGEDFEIILEQLLLLADERISKEDIDWLIYTSLLDFNTEILPGSRILLNSSDSIN